MALLNPLDALGYRKLDFLPKQFVVYEFKNIDFVMEDELSNWIRTNLQDRYFVGYVPLFESNKSKSILCVGFENGRELTYFILACPYLRRNHD